MVMTGLSSYCWMVRFTLVLICTSSRKDIRFIQLYLANTYVSRLGVRPGGFLCRHNLSSQCAFNGPCTFSTI